MSFFSCLYSKSFRHWEELSSLREVKQNATVPFKTNQPLSHWVPFIADFYDDRELVVKGNWPTNSLFV